MKIAAKKLASKDTEVVKTMPADLRDKLDGLTINEALERGIINDLGDANGKFFFYHADESIEAAYGIVQGYAVTLSKGLVAASDTALDIIGDLRFQKGISTIEGDGFGKAWFRLGMPAGINLGDAFVTLDAETVASK
jgi:hypothetical protein